MSDGPHFPLFIVYLADVPEESVHVHLNTWFYVIFYFRPWSVIAVINFVKNSRKICSLHLAATQSNRNNDSDAIVSCTVRNNDDIASAKGPSRAHNLRQFSLLKHWIVILVVPIKQFCIINNNQEQLNIIWKGSLSYCSLVERESFFEKIIVVITAADVGVSAVEHHLRYMPIYWLKI